MAFRKKSSLINQHWEKGTVRGSKLDEGKGGGKNRGSFGRRGGRISPYRQQGGLIFSGKGVAEKRILAKKKHPEWGQTGHGNWQSSSIPGRRRVFPITSLREGQRLFVEKERGGGGVGPRKTIKKKNAQFYNRGQLRCTRGGKGVRSLTPVGPDPF